MSALAASSTQPAPRARPWYCHQAVHAVVKRHTNVDGTVIYFTQETPCDCAPPSVQAPRPPQARPPARAAEQRSISAVRLRYRLPRPEPLPRFTSRRPPQEPRRTAPSPPLHNAPVPPPPRTELYARPLTGQAMVVSPCAPGCTPLQAEPSINVVAPVVFPTTESLCRPLSVPPMRMRMPSADWLPPSTDAGATTTTSIATVACTVAQHGHYQSFGFAFCPACGTGLLPAGTFPQYTTHTCPASHVRTIPAAPLTETQGLTLPHPTGIQVLGVASPESVSASTPASMQFCLLCGARIMHVRAADEAQVAPPPPPPPPAAAAVPSGPLGEASPPSTVLGLSQPAASVPPVPVLTTGLASLPPLPLSPPVPLSENTSGVAVPPRPVTPPPLGMVTPDQPSAPPPNAAAATLPPLHAPSQLPYGATDPTPVHATDDWLTRRDMQSVDAVLSAMVSKFQTSGGDLGADRDGRGACGLPNCPLCTTSVPAATATSSALPLGGRREDQRWWCGSPAVMIVHNHYYDGH